jgi:hypothetical protein
MLEDAMGRTTLEWQDYDHHLALQLQEDEQASSRTPCSPVLRNGCCMMTEAD